MRPVFKKALPSVFLFAALWAAGQFRSSPEIRTAFAADLRIGTAAGPGGDHLVDGEGKALYVFDKDPPSGSTCTDDCSLLWPPLTVSEYAPVGVSGGAQSSRLGIPYIRLDGSRQVVYAEHPLYYYQGDTKPGDTKGNNVISFGGRWCLVSPSGASMCDSGGITASATPAAGSTATSGPAPTTTAVPTSEPTIEPTTGPTSNPTSTSGPPACAPCTCTLPGQVNCLDSCGRSFPC